MLQELGVSPTRQRVEIGQLLFCKPQHLSADQVLAMLKGQNAHVSKATVYNTLNLFARKGLLREVFADPEKVFYDSRTQPHHHIYNVDTGELQDLDVDVLSLHGTPPLPHGTESVGVDVVIRVQNRA